MMRNMKYLICMIALILPLSLMAQKESKAKEILDKTAALFQKSTGIRATFNVKAMENSTKGTILLKGNKFQMKTTEMTTWFNGKTQWTYMANNQEVNVANPSAEDMQQINPYMFLNLYKKGCNYKTGKITSFGGKSVYEINLTPESKSADITNITIYIEKSSYKPVFIKMMHRNKSNIQITVLTFQNNQNLPESTFSFNKKEYPNVEVIDLR